MIFSFSYVLLKHDWNHAEGIEVTIIGGTNQKENGDTNSMGYIIKTKNHELIVVDGGRTKDADYLLEYIMKYGNGKVNHWYITHSHGDHVGALCELLARENCNIKIENLYYAFNDLSWYEKYDKRGYESEKKMEQNLENPKIINKVECQKGQNILMDNTTCEILRVANPEITKNAGNNSSMVFKITANDVNKSILFLGDIQVEEELLQNPEKLKANAVQMAHHGQNGVGEAIYTAIRSRNMLL